MAVPPVLVEIQAEQATPELVDTLLNACSRAVSSAKCVLAGEHEDAEQPRAVAIVTWVAPRTVRIQVGLREDRRWREQQVAFASEDQEAEVWRAVGFSTGTLVARESRVEKPASRFEGSVPAPRSRSSPPVEIQPALEPPPAPKLEPSPKPKPAPNPRSRPPIKPVPRPTPPAPRSFAAVDWLLTAGPGLTYISDAIGASWRMGTLVRGSWNHPRGPLATITVGEAMTPADELGLASWWSTLGAGVGYAVRSPVLRLELRAEVFGERLAVTAIDEQAKAFETRPTWLAGGRLSVDGVWMATRRLGVVAGSSVRGIGDEWTITLRDVPVAAAPAWAVGFSVGVRVESPH